MSKLHYAHSAEKRAIDWVRNNYGRTWRARISDPVSVAERTFPYPALRQHVARPFGSPQLNLYMQWARLCMRRNLYMPDLARRMSIGRV